MLAHFILRTSWLIKAGQIKFVGTWDKKLSPGRNTTCLYPLSRRLARFGPYRLTKVYSGEEVSPGRGK